MRLAAGVGGGGTTYSKLASTHIKTGEHLLSIFGAQSTRVGAALVLLCRRAAEVNPDFCGFVHQNEASKIKTRDRENFLTCLESLNRICFFSRVDGGEQEALAAVCCQRDARGVQIKHI